MKTNQFGDKGYYLDKSTNAPCKEETDGSYDMNKCYFDVAIRSQAAGIMGSKIHSRKAEKGLPNTQKPMWKHYDLQNKCDTTDVDKCLDNANCNYQLNVDNDENALKIKLNEMRIYKDSEFWNDKWKEEDDVCDWDGITCEKKYDPVSSKVNNYITKIDIDPTYFKTDKSLYCDKNNDISQNEWVSKQTQMCSTLNLDKACNDNQFCTWSESKPKCLDKQGATEDKCVSNGGTWGIPTQPIDKKYGDKYNKFYNKVYNTGYSNTGKCSLKKDYKVLSGLQKGDFTDKTLSDVLGEINNGRVGDIDIFDNIQVSTRDDVIMKPDNQETAVKGLVEETALSKYFFSAENTDAIQKTIRYRVHQKTNEVIDYQSSNELYIVMRSILLQYGNFKVSPSSLLQEIQNLNKHVILYCVNEVSSNVLQYKGYMKDLERLPIPLDRPSFNESGSRNRTYDISNHIGVK